MAEWTGQRSGPVAVYEDEAPRGGWAEILMLAERLAPKPSLLPADAAERAHAIGVAHEICGEMGLGWCLRNVAVHAGLAGEGGFPAPVAGYLASKYGYRDEEAPLYRSRVMTILEMLGARLRSQRDAGSRFYFGDEISAVDVYSATFAALLKPLPPEDCPMPDAMRQAFESADEEILSVLDPLVLEHRDFLYAEYMELPLTL